MAQLRLELQARLEELRGLAEEERRVEAALKALDTPTFPKERDG